jgi:AraC-like DNA-binding protein
MDYPDQPALVRTAGLTRAGPWFSSPGTRGSDVLLAVVVGGSGRHRCRAGSTVLGPGMVGLVQPEDPGQLLSDPDDPFTYVYCRFAGTWATAQARARIAAWAAPWQRLPVARQLSALIKHMGRIHRIDLPPCMGRAELLLIEALLALEPDSESPAAGQLSAERLDEFLRERIDRPSDLPVFARELGMSPAHLSRCCRRLTGRSVVHLHRELKMAWARELLAQGDTMASVAQRVGYSDPLYFSRVFRQEHGCSPRAWLRRA